VLAIYHALQRFTIQGQITYANARYNSGTTIPGHEKHARNLEWYKWTLLGMDFNVPIDGFRVKSHLRHLFRRRPKGLKSQQLSSHSRRHGISTTHTMSYNGDLSQVSSFDLREALEPITVPSRSVDATFSNWAKTFTCRPERVFEPTTVLHVRQVIELARREGATVHPVGVGHSPSDLACTKGWLMRMAGVKGNIKVSTSSVCIRTHLTVPDRPREAFCNVLSGNSTS
jgi:hypothetical protein